MGPWPIVRLLLRPFSGGAPCITLSNMATKSKPKTPQSNIALNKKAGHDYFIEQRYEAGLSL